jgi:predicted ferric reductase
MQKIIFYIFICFILVTTFNLWIFSVNDVGTLYAEPYRALSRILALIGTVLFALAMILSTRLSVFEDWLGGLDSVYRAHHIIGGFAFVTLILHPIFLAFQALPVFSDTLKYFFPIGTIAQKFGVLGVYALLFSFTFMLFLKISYKWWVASHQVLYLSFVFSSLHIFLLSSDISHSLVLRIWILVFVIAGLLAGFYIIFLYAQFGPRYRYIVREVLVKGDIVDIILLPMKRPLNHVPGQFIFVQFHVQGLRGERHPFSVASITEEGGLRLVVRMSGDFTRKLPLLQSGVAASVYGPYGRFGSVFLKTRKDLVWIAGGIGITPFLSMLHHEAIHHTKRKIYFLYSYLGNDDPFLPEIETTLQFTPHIRFMPWSTNERGLVNAQKITTGMGREFTDCYIFICGPLPMMESLHSQFRKRGVPDDHIIFENFSLK